MKIQIIIKTKIFPSVLSDFVNREIYKMKSLYIKQYKKTIVIFR